ncbi:glycosyltransferase family 4 protein [Allosphingosinicella deserti]|uniref:Glycosyltransferase family 1 protein n=1 Tax=Allosphingosinicella deserti TaxID=2116704 RepID=A0A2P7QEQ3_9SPHN|nr:glycosyltransferase family 4 protein [Sphingomonas deserti]PSJ36424.1 glycosyltransferase family 1 protein [Sphingomonas deserti]
MKIVVLASLAMSLVRFRGKLLEELVAAGHDVVACAPDADETVTRDLAEIGVTFRRTPMSRAGVNPLQDIATFGRYLALFARERPGAVIAYTQKPIIYGGLASRLTGARLHVIMSGLGYVYSSEADHRPGLRKIVSWLYRLAVRRAATIFVFNSDDRRMMIQHAIIDARHHVVQVPGSGVDTDHYAAAPLPSGPPTFLMMGRLMRDKGVGDYIAAARQVRSVLPDARFMLLGRPETENPTGYSDADVAGWSREGLIEHVPETSDVRPYLARCHAFVLPSFYREGLPRTILEALSVGRPVITCDLPGCRDAVTDGESGWLVPPRRPDRLAETMLLAVEDPERLERMRISARRSAERVYDVKRVNALLLREMGLAARRLSAAAGTPAPRVRAEA